MKDAMRMTIGDTTENLIQKHLQTGDWQSKNIDMQAITYVSSKHGVSQLYLSLGIECYYTNNI